RLRGRRDDRRVHTASLFLNALEGGLEDFECANTFFIFVSKVLEIWALIHCFPQTAAKQLIPKGDTGPSSESFLALGLHFGGALPTRCELRIAVSRLGGRQNRTAVGSCKSTFRSSSPSFGGNANAKTYAQHCGSGHGPDAGSGRFCRPDYRWRSDKRRSHYVYRYFHQYSRR